MRIIIQITHVVGYIIGHLKTNAPHFICQPVRILPDLTDAVLAILLVDFCCIGRAYSIALQKYHHILDVFLLLPTFLNLGKALFADTRHFQQFFDVVLNDFQCLETELFDDEFGILGADTFYRTTNRHDLSLKPPRKTMLELLKDAGRDVIAVGKIFDIFDGEGVTEKIKTTGNTNGIAFTKALQTRDFEGLAFVNLVDFDMLYGHRRDVAGYAAAATEFDKFVADFIPGMREGDILMVTADHGCDPSYTKTTDHTREYVPYLICGKGVKPGVDLGTKLCFGTIAHTICDYLGVDASTLDGQSVLSDILA